MFTTGANSSNVRFHPPHSSEGSYSPQHNYTLMQSNKLSHFDYRDNDFSRNSNAYVPQSLYAPVSSSSNHPVYQMSHIPQYSPSTQQHIAHQLSQMCPPPSTMGAIVPSKYPAGIQTSHSQSTYISQAHAIQHHQTQSQAQSHLTAPAPVPSKPVSPPTSQGGEQPTFATLQPRARTVNPSSNRLSLPSSSLTATGRSNVFLSNTASNTSSNYSSSLVQRSSHPNVVISPQNVEAVSTQPSRIQSLANNTPPSVLLSPKSNAHTVSPSMSHTFNTNQSIKSHDRKHGAKSNLSSGTDNGSSQVVSSANMRPIIINAPNLKTTNQLQGTKF